MSEWQPIGTAPKDGSEFLAVDRRTGFRNVVSWHVGPNDMRTGWEDAEGNLVYHPEAFSDWMPLPEPPQR